MYTEYEYALFGVDGVATPTKGVYLICDGMCKLAACCSVLLLAPACHSVLHKDHIRASRWLSQMETAYLWYEAHKQYTSHALERADGERSQGYRMLFWHSESEVPSSFTPYPIPQQNQP